MEQYQELRFKVGLSWKGPHNLSVTYSKADVVETDDFVCASRKSNNINRAITDRDWWMVLIDKRRTKEATDKAEQLNRAVEAYMALATEAEEDRKGSEVIRKQNESQRVANESDREAAAKLQKYQHDQQMVASSAATANANEVAEHPSYVGEDYFVYVYDLATHAYNKTNLYVKGEGFSISGTFGSVAAMEAAVATLEEGHFYMVVSNVEDEDNGKLYIKNDGRMVFIVDMSGMRGFTGKSPQIEIGNVIAGTSKTDAGASLTPNGVDADGNPKFLMNLRLPVWRYEDFTPEQIEELQSPAAEKAIEVEERMQQIEEIASEQRRTESEQFSASQTQRTSDFNKSEESRTGAFNANEQQRQQNAATQRQAEATSFNQVKTGYENQIAQQQKAFDDNEATRDKVVNDKVAELNPYMSIVDIMGMYSDRESLTLTPAYSGKAIVAPRGAKLGALTDYAGASVSVEYSVTRGDMLLIKPGKTSNDYFTVAQVTVQNGVKLYEKVMSLNELAEVPTDGFLRFLVMPSDMVIVVTFFDQEAAFDATVRVMRCGAFATISTQVGNIYADLKENYAKAQGYYRDLHCGVADSLGADPSKTYTEVIPCGRPLGNAGSLTDGTGGSHSPESIGEVSTVEIKEIEGDCFGGNQMVPDDRINGSSDNIAYTLCQVPANTKVLLLGFLKSNVKAWLSIYGTHYGETKGDGTFELNVQLLERTINSSAFVQYEGAQGSSIVERKDVSVIQLKTLFPTPSGQSFVSTLRENDTHKVLDRLGFFAFLSESEE